MWLAGFEGEILRPFRTFVCHCLPLISTLSERGYVSKQEMSRSRQPASNGNRSSPSLAGDLRRCYGHSPCFLQVDMLLLSMLLIVFTGGTMAQAPSRAILLENWGIIRMRRGGHVVAVYWWPLRAERWPGLCPHEEALMDLIFRFASGQPGGAWLPCYSLFSQRPAKTGATLSLVHGHRATGLSWD